MSLSLSNTVLFIVCYYFFRFAGLIRKFLQDTKVGGGRGRRQEEAAAADSFLNRLSFVAENEEENSENKVSENKAQEYLGDLRLELRLSLKDECI